MIAAQNNTIAILTAEVETLRARSPSCHEHEVTALAESLPAAVENCLGKRLHSEVQGVVHDTPADSLPRLLDSQLDLKIHSQVMR